MEDQRSTLLSINICTYNRAKDLKTLLEELCKQFKKIYEKSEDPHLLKEALEILVIDNNSTDNTSDLVLDIISKKDLYSPDIKYILETQQGSSYARNRGIREAQGQLLAFIDDDVLLEKNWLMNCLIIAGKKPSEYVAGARVVAQWDQDLPNWLNLEPPFEIIQSCFPAHDYGEKVLHYPFELKSFYQTAIIQEDNPVLDTELQENKFFKKLESVENRFKRKVQNPISACFLASKDIFEKHGGFRNDLGIIADRRGACEDTEFFWRLIAEDVKVIYQPAICVIHPIPAKRMTKDFVLKWYDLIGYTLEYMKANNLVHHATNISSYDPKKSETKLKLQLLFFFTCYLASYFTFDPVKIFWFRANISKAQGGIRFARNKQGLI